MKKTGAIIAAIVSVCIGGILAAPTLVKLVKEREAEEAAKAPIKEEVVLLDAAKTPNELGVTSTTLKLNGDGGSLTLESGSFIKFEAGCGADSFVANVRGHGSVTLAYEKQAVYTADSRYELYKFKAQSLTPGVAYGADQAATVDLYAMVGGRMYLIKTQTATITGIDLAWELEENELPPIWLN